MTNQCVCLSKPVLHLLLVSPKERCKADYAKYFPNWSAAGPQDPLVTLWLLDNVAPKPQCCACSHVHILFSFWFISLFRQLELLSTSVWAFQNRLVACWKINGGCRVWGHSFLVYFNQSQPNSGKCSSEKHVIISTFGFVQVWNEINFLEFLEEILYEEINHTANTNNTVFLQCSTLPQEVGVQRHLLNNCADGGDPYLA